jgi:hypothetical protein
VISRDAARMAGLKRYFTGETCVNGHRAERYVSNTCCVTCVNQSYKPVAESKNPMREAAPRPKPQTGPRAPSVDYSHMTAAQIEAWYAKVRRIQRGERFLFNSNRKQEAPKPLDAPLLKVVSNG